MSPLFAPDPVAFSVQAIDVRAYHLEGSEWDVSLTLVPRAIP
jgi:hypothetical protein